MIEHIATLVALIVGLGNIIASAWRIRRGTAEPEELGKWIVLAAILVGLGWQFRSAGFVFAIPFTAILLFLEGVYYMRARSNASPPLPSYTLWRGNTLLGRFEHHRPVMHHDESVGAFGVLVPTGAFAGTTPMMQLSVTAWPGQPIYQHAMEPRTLGEMPARLPHPGPETLEPIENNGRGVPADRVFTIRDQDGHTIDTRMICLELSIIPDHADLAKVAAANPGVPIARRMWNVIFSRHDATD